MTPKTDSFILVVTFLELCNCKRTFAVLIKDLINCFLMKKAMVKSVEALPNKSLFTLNNIIKWPN